MRSSHKPVLSTCQVSARHRRFSCRVPLLLTAARGGQWFSEAVVLPPHPPPRRHLAMSRDISGCHHWGRGAAGTCWVETWDAAQHSAGHKAGPHNRGLCGPNLRNAEVETSFWVDAALFLIYNEETEAQGGYKVVWRHTAGSGAALRA